MRLVVFFALLYLFCTPTSYHLAAKKHRGGQPVSAMAAKSEAEAANFWASQLGEESFANDQAAPIERSTKRSRAHAPRQTKKAGSRRGRGKAPHTDLYAEIHPISTMLIPAVGATFASRIYRSHWLELNYTQGTVKLKTLTSALGMPSRIELPEIAKPYEGETNKVIDDIQRLAVYHATTSLRLKSHWTKSFYTNLGFGERQIGFSYPLDEVSDYKGLEAAVRVKKPGFLLGLGNRWSFDGLHFGVDWLSAFVPFDGVSQIGAKPKKAASTAERFNRMASMPTVEFLTVAFGYVW